MKRILFLFAFFIVASCDQKESWDNIKFYDNSQDIKLRLLYEAPFCLDSNLSSDNPFINGVGVSPFQMGQPLPILNTMGCKNLVSCLDNFPQKSFSCFLFHVDTLLNVPWDSIRLHKKYIRRYIIRSSNVKDNSHTIYYP